MYLRTPKLLKHRSPALKIASRRRRRRQRMKKPDPEGQVYLIEGEFKGKTFWKFGRSSNAIRRFKEHERTCRGVTWRYLHFWRTKRHISVEQAVHKKMMESGFKQFEKVCSCGRLHSERFYLPGGKLDEAWALAEYIARRQLKK